MARLDYAAPGVYVEEVRRGGGAIPGISMSVAGFVGFTEDVRGGAHLFEPTLVTSWNQYLQYFAKMGSDGYTDFGSYLPYSVKGWFDNGGGRCWIVSLGSQLPTQRREDLPEAQDNPLEISTFGKTPTLQFALKPEQVENGRLTVVVEPDTPRPTESPDEEPPFDTGEFFKVTLARRGNILTENRMEDGEELVGTDTVYRHLTMDRNVAPEAGTYVETALQDSHFVSLNILSERGMPLSRRPADGQYEISPPLVHYTADRLPYQIYGKQDERTGVQGLFEIDDVSIISCPDIMFAYQRGLLNIDQVNGLMEMLITKCENSAPSPAYKMVVLDTPPVRIGQDNDRAIEPERCRPQDAAKWLDMFGRRSQFAALYYPWIQVPDIRRSGQPTMIPPSGHMLGIWARTDETRGIHKAPANETPRGVTGLAYDTNFREQEYLNPLGINCIRKFPNRGLQVWGARTLVDPTDTDWRYISVRRIMSYVAKSIELGTQWAVFEPNDVHLWAKVRRTISNFLERLWRDGALYGRSKEEAFYVKCDQELNTPETIRLGRLYVEIGVSPVRPAEFIVFRISQYTNDYETDG